MNFILSTSNRFFLDELLAILKLREKNDGIKLAMLIIYARASKDDEVYGASDHVTPENYAVYYFIKAKEE